MQLGNRKCTGIHWQNENLGDSRENGDPRSPFIGRLHGDPLLPPQHFTEVQFDIAIGVATVAKIAMDFSCPCSKVHVVSSLDLL